MQILRALWILANNGKRSRMAPVSAGCLFLHLAGIVVVLMGLLPRQLFTCGNMYRVGAPSLYITVYVTLLHAFAIEVVLHVADPIVKHVRVYLVDCMGLIRTIGCKI